MDVLLISPGYPAEMPYFTRGLARTGARVLGVGDQPLEAMPAMARQSLAGYLRVGHLWDAGSMAAELRAWLGSRRPDRIECLWEPGVLLAASLREELGVPGMGVVQATRFRDKEKMKAALDAAGIRTPRHFRATTAAETREAVAAIGYPAILKPIAGAGSADTFRIDSGAELETALGRLQHVAELSVEEFIEGEEYTFDTICAGGRILYWNISWYRPRPLIGRQVAWISPQTVCLRHPGQAELAAGRAMGEAVIAALGFDTGFTHMEWFARAGGEAVFGEIAARPPGAKSVDIMNYTSDTDLFRGWAEAVTLGALRQPVERRYNSVIVFKRAHGNGRIQRIEGLGPLLGELGDAVMSVELLPVGATRRDWKQTLLSDGHVILRHPDLDTTLRMADRVGTELQMYAG